MSDSDPIGPEGGRFGPLRAAVALLTLATAGIHLYLGGVLGFSAGLIRPINDFVLNGAGYLALLVLFFLPGLSPARRRLVGRALMVYATATVAGWAVMGARISVAYLTKAIEVGLIVLLVVDDRRRALSRPG